MKAGPEIFDIRSSPHDRQGMRTDVIMRNVVWALLPVVGWAIYAYGLTAAAGIAVATLSCVLTEQLLGDRRGPATVRDWSVTITGILYGLTLPPGLPLWMVAFGGFLGVAVGKSLFGGLGMNSFNPALVGRALLQAAFPVAMTTWRPAFAPERFTSLPADLWAVPFSRASIDAVTGATPLGAMKFEQIPTETASLFLGMTNGSVGESSAALILVGGAYLAVRKMLNWRIPVAILGTVALLSAIFHALDPVQFASAEMMLFSGGLMLGAVFMATDMVASPVTSFGVLVYGMLIGALVVVIRYWGGLPEGVMYAILFANACSPLIDRTIQPRVYGTRRGALAHE